MDEKTKNRLIIDSYEFRTLFNFNISTVNTKLKKLLKDYKNQIKKYIAHVDGQEVVRYKFTYEIALKIIEGKKLSDETKKEYKKILNKRFLKQPEEEEETKNLSFKDFLEFLALKGVFLNLDNFKNKLIYWKLWNEEKNSPYLKYLNDEKMFGENKIEVLKKDGSRLLETSYNITKKGVNFITNKLNEELKEIYENREKEKEIKDKKEIKNIIDDLFDEEEKQEEIKEEQIEKEKKDKEIEDMIDNKKIKELEEKVNALEKMQYDNKEIIEPLFNLEKELLNDNQLSGKILSVANKVIKNLIFKNRIKDQQMGELEPELNYYDIILHNAQKTIPALTIAKDYGLGEDEFNEILNKCKIQYKFNNTWLLYKKYQNKGYTKTEETETDIRTYWTPKGRIFIYELLKNNRILPIIEKELKGE